MKKKTFIMIACLAVIFATTSAFRNKETKAVNTYKIYAKAGGWSTLPSAAFAVVDGTMRENFGVSYPSASELDDFTSEHCEESLRVCFVLIEFDSVGNPVIVDARDGSYIQ